MKWQAWNLTASNKERVYRGSIYLVSTWSPAFLPWAATFIRIWTLFPSCPWQPAETGLSKQIQKISFNGRFCSSVHRNKTQLPQSNLILGWTYNSRCHCGWLPGHCLLAHNQVYLVLRSLDVSRVMKETACDLVPTDSDKRDNASAGRCGKALAPRRPVRGCGGSKLLSAHNNILLHVPHCSVQGKLDTNKRRHNQGQGWREWQ